MIKRILFGFQHGIKHIRDLFVLEFKKQFPIMPQSTSKSPELIQPHLNKEIGKIEKIGQVNPNLLDRFKENNLTIPGLLNLKDFLSFIVVLAIAGLPFISKVNEDTLLIILLFSSAIFSAAMIYHGVVHVITYKRWLMMFGDVIEKQLAWYKEVDPQKYIKIIVFISRGETREFLKKYPEEYVVLGVPHLWNSLEGTKMTVFIATIIFITIMMFILKYYCGVPGFMGSLRSCF